MVEMPRLRSLRELRTGRREAQHLATSNSPKRTRGALVEFVVEMPGVEPGSNVEMAGLYDHVSSISRAHEGRDEESARGLMRKCRRVIASRDAPTSLMTPRPLSEDRGETCPL